MKRSPLRKLSSKRRKQVNEYLKERKKYLEEHGTCEVCKEADSVQIHHVFGRSGERIYNASGFLATCQSCHSFIHANPEAARKAGWMIDRLGNL